MPVRHPDVDRYLLGLPAERRKPLKALRQIVHEVVPDAIESMDYRMPTFRAGDHVVCSLASQKAHMSLYVCEDEILEPFRTELEGLDRGVGCIRFVKDGDLDPDLARRIIKHALEVATAKE